jgi:outer membrane receptor protein involved in Fe transport
MIRKLNYLVPICICLILFLFISLSDVFAQGKIVGHVKSKTSGEALIGVSVVLLNTHTGAATDIEGDYIIINVPVGSYSVQASMIGASKITKTGVVVSDGQTSKVDFELEETALVNQEMIVTARQDILHKEISSSQIVIDNQQIKEAAGTRTLQDFLNTQAGITGANYLEIRGGKPQETGTVVNGLTFVDARVGKAEAFIPTSAVEQVSLKAGGMSAEYGEFRSGMVNVTTKSGSNDGYHGSFSFQQSPGHLKRFGKSIYDPSNNYLRPHLDPDIAFIGVTNAVTQGIITAYDAQQFAYNTSFTGFITAAKSSIPSNWSQSLAAGITAGRYAAGTTITPVNLYLYDAWMHMITPDWDKLNAAITRLNSQGQNVGSTITDQNLMNLFSNHSRKEGKYGDFNFDGGFGGPVPIIGSGLGNATFYLSNVTNRYSYLEPQELDYNLSSTTLLSLKANITNAITFKLTAAYSYQKGMNSARGADSEPATLQNALYGVGSNVAQGLDRGAMQPEDNKDLYLASGSNYAPGQYWYYVTMLQPWIENKYLVGMEINHAISPTTFYNFTGSYQATKENIDPANSDARDNTVLGWAGPIPLTQQPYGRRVLNVGQAEDTISGWRFDQYYSVPGISDRFDSKGGVFYDHSNTQQLRLKLNFGSQISKMHFIKAGIEFNYIDINNMRWAYWPSQGAASMYEYNFKVAPRTLGAYFNDEITFEDMVANFGVRMDYYSMGDLKWPTGNPWSGDAFAAPGSWTPTDYLAQMQSGRSIIWEHWATVNDALVAAGQTPLLQSVDSHIVFSPRFGISFPVTDRSKFYFNYGHYRSLPALSELFLYDFRYDASKGGIVELGNPNLAPSKTIMYELGVDYNLLDQYLIHIAGYYKDITGEVRPLTYSPTTTGIATYRFRTNDSYRTVQGLELQVTKAMGEWLTGWLNVQYSYSVSGNTGRSIVYQDPSSNASASAFNYVSPTKPIPTPSFRANITLKSPSKWGDWLGGWNLSFLPHWQMGNYFNYNPRSVDGAYNEFQWPDLWIVDMKISKTVDVGLLKATIYLDVNNLFNNKYFQYNYAFAGGGGSASGTDYQNYLASLHLSQYSNPYWDAVRSETTDSYLYPGYVYRSSGTNSITGVSHKAGDVVCEDKIGDLHSTDKPWVNDPNVDLFTYGTYRSVWFGIRFDF